MTKHELADSMLRGIEATGVIESVRHYISPKEYSGRHFPKDASFEALCAVCALGAAVVGVYGDYVSAFNAFHRTRKTQGKYNAFAELLDIPVALAIEIEHKHLNGMPVQQIAAWLKSPEGEAVNV